MERKTLRLELKGLDEAGTFTGYVAVTGNRDLGGDIIEPGAFAKTLKDKGGRVPLLDGHDSFRRLGILQLSEDSKGLKVDKGVLNLKKTSAMEAYADLQFYHEQGMPLGMSIGYDVIQKEYRTDKGGKTTRLLKEVALWEGSIVTFPMNPKARVTGVKDLEGAAANVRSLVEDLKAGRVISSANMAKLMDAMQGLNGAMEQIMALIEAADSGDGNGKAADGAAQDQTSGPDQVHPEAPTVNADWISRLRAEIN